jgi:hypothetical protein
MIEVAKTTDAIRLSFLRSALEDAGIASTVFDAGAGSIWPGAIPMRLMVEDKNAWRAKHVLAEAERDIGFA